jgi:putative effector of murein hydrolase
MKIALANALYRYKPQKKYAWWQLVVTFCYGVVAGILYMIVLLVVYT